MQPTKAQALDSIRTLLRYIGEDPNREGLKDTPERVLRSYEEVFSGYTFDGDPPCFLLTQFDEPCDEMVICKNIEFYSHCEHHMMPFFGKAHVAYLPSEKVLGLSKLARVVEVFSRRLQIQERLCRQVTSFLEEHLQPRGAACIMEAKHFCMTCRGVNKQNSVMVTSSLTGAFRNPEVRTELFTLVRD